VATNPATLGQDFYIIFTDLGAINTPGVGAVHEVDWSKDWDVNPLAIVVVNGGQLLGTGGMAVGASLTARIEMTENRLHLNGGI
jgi:hypothetical protein